MTATIAEFKTTLKLCTLVSILEEEGEIDDKGGGKASRREFSNVIFEAGLPLSGQQEITIMKKSLAPSGEGLPTDSPEAAPGVEKEAVATRTTTTTPHKESNQEEVEVSS